MQPPSRMQTGFGSDDPDDPRLEQMLTQVQALMLAFSREAMVVAGRCTCAQGRSSVSATDMRDALMYCARTFFEKDDADIKALVDEAVQLMDEADSDEDDEGDEDSEESEDEDATETIDQPKPSPRDVQLRRNVQTVVKAWPLWTPTDPIHVLVKNAIDNTPC